MVCLKLMYYKRLMIMLINLNYLWIVLKLLAHKLSPIALIHIVMGLNNDHFMVIFVCKDMIILVVWVVKLLRSNVFQS